MARKHFLRICLANYVHKYTIAVFVKTRQSMTVRFYDALIVVFVFSFLENAKKLYNKITVVDQLPSNCNFGLRAIQYNFYDSDRTANLSKRLFTQCNKNIVLLNSHCISLFYVIVSANGLALQNGLTSGGGSSYFQSVYVTSVSVVCFVVRSIIVP